MNPVRSLFAIAAACAACATPELPVEVEVLQAQVLRMDVPAQLLLDVRVGVPTAGVEISVEGDEGLQVRDYAPRMLPATKPMAGSQLFVNLVPKSPGDWLLTVRLGLHMGGDRRTRTVTLPFTVVSPITVPPLVEALPEPSAGGG